MRTYIAEVRNGTSMVNRMIILASSRGEAVHKAQLDFWYTYRGSLGPAYQVLTVNDPYREVVYSETFCCTARKNLFLTPEDVRRVLHEAGGELLMNTLPYRRGVAHPPLRRRKRRRDFGLFIAPLVTRMKNGRLYYRVNTRAQVVRRGRRYRKRKYVNIPLEARTLQDAIGEIKSRRLIERNRLASVRESAVRNLRILEMIAGARPMPRRLRAVYSNAVRRYMV